MRLAARLAFLPGLLLASVPVLAQPPATGSSTPARPVAGAVRMTGRVTVDGRLDEAAWAAATPVTAFTQVDPDEGQPASERTEIRVLYDDEALYVGARLYDRQPVSRRLGRRDMSLGGSDWLGVVIDSYNDGRTAFSFDINPSGVRRDASKSDSGDNMAWDAVWDGAATVDAEGWTAEVRIPFSQLRFSNALEHTWGIQLERVIARRNEYAVFSFTPKSERGGIAAYGRLTGLRGVRPGRRLELLPYALAKAEVVDPGANPFRSRREASGAAGLDLRYRVTSDLTLNATVNPDFGQVEVDPAVVNLSAFETFFEEKRPFFIEGSNLFDFGTGSVGPGSVYSNLFYSRRIGRSPQIMPGTARRDAPTQTTILGAAKLSGKTRGGWSVGVLDAFTQRERARFLDAANAELRQTAEPLTHYGVGRLSREWRRPAGQSSLGLVATAVNRDLDGATRPFLRANAYAGGVDAYHEWANRAWSASAFFAASRVDGAAEALARTQRTSAHYYQRPDATHLTYDSARRSLTGWAGQAQVFKQAGLYWSGDVGAYAASPGYEINDAGFQSRADEIGANGRIIYAERRPGRVFRFWQLYQTAIGTANFAGQPTTLMFQSGAFVQRLNFWSVNAGVNTSLPTFDDRLTRGGVMARRPFVGEGILSINSDPRQRIVGNLFMASSRSSAGGWHVNAQASATLRRSPRWNLTVGPSLRVEHVAAQYLNTRLDGTSALPAPTPFAGPDPAARARYLFAPLDQTTLSANVRLNVTFTPDISLELFAQPFIAAGDFGAPGELARARSFDFTTYGEDAGTATYDAANARYVLDPDGTGPAASFTLPNPDFNVRSLRGNAVFRWEYRPGSTLFLVWQQERAGEDVLGRVRLDRDLGELFRTKPDNVFLVKLTWWLNP
ncbi:MAG TPA: DUF5916 domain-containing protein [Rhodothermales bacterium]|nr:DUF5916 domain-containing protein [Rhodothermales bacterium]